VSVSIELVQQALKAVKDPNTQIDFVSAKSARNIKVNEGDVSLDILLGYPAKSQIDLIRKLVVTAIRELPGVLRMSALRLLLTSLPIQCSVVSNCYRVSKISLQLLAARAAWVNQPQQSILALASGCRRCTSRYFGC
jgi:hypothetical protein